MLIVTGQPAFVLHARPWRETSLLLECLCRDYGRMGLLARGVRTARSARRDLFEPFQELEIDFRGRGELPVIGHAEAVAVPRLLRGKTLYAGLYLNELLVRLLARRDPYPDLLARYRAVLDALVADDNPAWTLRCFERDFLAMIGYGLSLEYDATSGEPLEPDVEYVYLPDEGPVRWRGQPGLRLLGSDLLALAQGEQPARAAEHRLRQLIRQLVAWWAPGGGLQSWRVLRVAGVTEPREQLRQRDD